MAEKITLENLSDITPEELLNDFPFTRENRKHIEKIFNDERYDDEDFFEECYKVAKEQLMTNN